MTSGSLPGAASLARIFSRWHRFLTWLIGLLAVEALFAAAIRINVLSRLFTTGRQVSFLEALSSVGLLLFPVMLYAIVRVRTAQRELHLIVQSEQESAERTRTLLDTTAEGIFALDESGLCTMANRAAGELLGYVPDDLLGQRMHELIHHTRADGSSFPVEECPIYRAMTDGRTNSVEDEVFWRKDGSSFHVAYSSAPIVNGESVLGAVVSFRNIEERRRMERSIREAERQTRRFMDDLPLAVFVVDEAGKPVYANHASTELLGLPADESLEAADLSSAYKVYVSGTDELYDPERLPVIRALTGEVSTVDDMEIHRPDGTVVPLEVWAAPIRDEDGTIRHAAAAFSDIRARRAADAELAEQSEMLDLVDDAVIALDPEGRITYWNQTAVSIYGYEKDEAIGRISFELLRTTFPKPLEEIRAEISEVGRWEGELVHLRKDGSKVVVASRWVLRRDETGRELQILEVNNDITDRKRREEERAREQDLLSAIFETSPDIIATITSRQEITYVNPAAHRILGFDLDQIFGKGSREAMHPGDRDAVLDLLRSTFAEGPGGQIRVRVRNLVGDWIWLDVRIRRMGVDTESAVVMAHDITQQVRLEEGLQQAKQDADAANLAKSEFLSRMSHELRTPLNAILGFAQLLQMEGLEEEQRESAEQIVKGGRRLLDLINEVLDIARIESGRMSLSLEPVSALEVIDECVGLIKPLAGERGITVHVECPDPDRHVWADRHRLGQVLLNLLSNAVKYNVSEGSVTVTCRVPDKDRVRLGITDTGPGIPPEKVDLLFTPFERLGAEQSAVEGTGLGLALSKNLVEAMGGTVLVDPMNGEGSTFWVELKASRGPAPATASVKERRVEEPLSTLRGAARVLYIEDNLANIRLIERVLARWKDVTVIRAMSGALGLDLARQHSPDLILLDLGLPDMKGDQVFARLRRDPRTSGIPIVILSADATNAEIKRMLAAGADDYLTKPIDVAMFLEVFERRLGTGVVDDVRPSTSPRDVTPSGEPRTGIDRPGQPGVGSADPVPVLDSRIVTQLRELDALSEISELFMTQSSARLEAIRVAVRRLDIETLKSELHALKGVSATAGAARLAERCRRFEESVGSGEGASGEEELDLLETELEEAQAAFAAEIGEPKDPGPMGGGPA